MPQNEEPVGPEKPETEPQQAAPATDPEKERLAAEIEAMRREREQDRALLAAAVSGYSSNRGSYQPQQVPQRQGINEEELSDEARTVLRQAREEFQTELQRREQAWNQGYSSARQTDDARWAGIARRAVLDKYSALYPDLAKRLDEYVRTNNIPAQYLAQDGAFETVALMQIGQIEADRRLAEIGASPGLGSAGRRRPDDSDLPTPKFVDEDDVAILRRQGIDITQAEAEFLLEQEGKHRHGVSAEDFAAFSKQSRARRNH